ncbi:hypothetical protein CY35_09G044800 [Sphagnum magellanicum]|nr:hypothetical protein CY35_09G044800 [Sphagnum magellanicum]
MAYWEVTQKLLQTETCIVRKPRLTEALLKKPPFRFLHDVISEACRQTGFAKGLFSPEELLSTNIKDKESKVKYLWKIINCVGITLNASVPARPLKEIRSESECPVLNSHMSNFQHVCKIVQIVAGLEAEQTNVFLQMFAIATTIESSVQQQSVNRVLAGEIMPSVDQGGMEWIQQLKVLKSQGQHNSDIQPLANAMANKLSPEKQDTLTNIQSTLIETNNVRFMNLFKQ